MNTVFGLQTELVKGIGIGMAAGAVVGMIIAPKKKQKASMLGKAVKAAGEIIDNMTGIIG